MPSDPVSISPIIPLRDHLTRNPNTQLHLFLDGLEIKPHSRNINFSLHLPDLLSGKWGTVQYRHHSKQKTQASKALTRLFHIIWKTKASQSRFWNAQVCTIYFSIFGLHSEAKAILYESLYPTYSPNLLLQYLKEIQNHFRNVMKSNLLAIL